MAILTLVYIYDVRRVDGDWLYLTDEWKKVRGWVPAKEVVELNGSIQFFTQALNDNPENAFFYVMRDSATESTGDLMKPSAISIQRSGCYRLKLAFTFTSLKSLNARIAWTMQSPR